MQPAAAGEGMTVAVRAAPADRSPNGSPRPAATRVPWPREAHLTRAAASSTPDKAAPADAAAKPRWDGTLVMSLPAAR